MNEDFLRYSDPKEAFLDEDLSKLGDTLVNLIYSLARSFARGLPDGGKVPNRVLSNSLAGAGLRDLAPSRVDKHRLGDIAEAVIAFAWLKDKIRIEEAAKILSASLADRDFRNRRDLLDGAEEGFKNLLSTVYGRFSIE